jgi:hypothetical protein
MKRHTPGRDARRGDSYEARQRRLDDEQRELDRRRRDDQRQPRYDR